MVLTRSFLLCVFAGPWQVLWRPARQGLPNRLDSARGQDDDPFGRRVQVDLQALHDIVLELNEGRKRVGGGPRLSEREPVLAVGVLGLAERGDDTCGRRGAGDFECDTRRGRRLDLERCRADREVLAEQVAGGLAKVLQIRRTEKSASAP